MRRLDSPLSSSCPEHPSRTIEGLDMTLGAKKLTYCMDCILGSQDPKAVFNSIVTFPIFLETVAKFFDEKRVDFMASDSLRHKCLKMVDEKMEAINRLTVHIVQEKKKLEQSFEGIRKFVNEMLDEKKAEYFKLLDQQLENLITEYNHFERNIQKYYPCREDIDSIFPSRKDLEEKFKKIETAVELHDFIEKLKIELEMNKESLEKAFNDEFKENALDGFKGLLVQLKAEPPIFEPNVQIVKEKLTKSFYKCAESSFILRNPILTGGSDLIITGPAEFFLIRNWLPVKYQESFSPKLIYKGLKDGISSESFLSKCNNKRPTITLIKGTFADSSDVVVIGGFIDKPWVKNGAYILSKEAFIFSLTSRIKCPIMDGKSAAFTSDEPILAFGWGHDIAITRNITESYMLPHSYLNAEKIVRSPSYKGGKISFIPVDLEVYII